MRKQHGMWICPVERPDEPIGSRERVVRTLSVIGSGVLMSETRQAMVDFSRAETIVSLA
jgi:hypothetical protein